MFLQRILLSAFVCLCLAIAAAAQTINPADYGNITLRLKAEDLTYSNNASVTNWGSFTAGNTATPTFIASDARFNNRPVVKFDGVDDVLKFPTANLNAQTIFAVVTLENSATSLAGLLSSGNDTLNIRRADATSFYRSPGHGQDGNDFTYATGSLSVNNVAGGAYTTGAAHIVMAVAAANKTYPDIWIGSPKASLGRYWTGSVAEIIVYDGVLTQTGMDRVGWYLQNKYNIANGGYPSPTPSITSFTATAGGMTASTGVLSSAGAPVTLAWNVANATTVSINNGALASSSSATGSVTVSPSVTTTYTLSASNGAGAVTKPVTVYIGATPQPLVLNEFLADNGSSITDEDGAKSDWIELYNPNPFAVSAGGWKLRAGATLWTFPDVTIEGGAYPVVFASGKNRTNPEAPLHTSFKLDADGESLALVKPDGSTATEFAPAYPAQRMDISCGKDGGGATVYYPTPTPGAANSATTVAGFVADTIFSVKRGFFSAPQSVAITCATAGATIRYTLDNSTPTDTNGVVYAGPITISGTTVVRARAFKSGLLPSNTDTQSYVFVADVPNQVYASGAAPAGWPTPGSAQLNSQAMRYGFQSALKAQYTAQQLTDALNQVPSLSIVTDQANLTDQLTGIYSNADQKGDAWERSASVEYLAQDNSTGFHINCGLRIRGGASRGDYAPKHSFRLYFRKQYGDGSLKFPLHGTGGTNEFETIDIRSEQNYSWANDTGTQNTQVREVFSRDLAGALGQPQTRSRYLHVYLNGQYWGLYMTEERAQEDYGASYFGGAPEDYDVVQTSNHPNFTYELSSGTIDAWQQTWNLARACATNPTNANYFALLGRDASGLRVAGMPVYVDPDHLAAYMLLHYYTGDGDGPLSNFLGFNRANNWRGFRNRLTDMGWRFFPHDCEHTLLASSWVDGRATANTTGGSNRSNFTYSNSEWLHEDLATNAEYKLKIADIAQKHLFNGGALTPAKAQALFDARAAQISQAIIADCVRWGTSTTNHTFAQWQARLDNIRANFFPSRTAALIGHMQTRGFLPSASAPTFSQRGGKVPANYALTLSAGGQTGAIYYTLDGSDPRAVGGAAAAGAQTYAGAVTISQNNTRVRTRFLSSGGVWSPIDEAVFSFYSPAIAGKLVISKIHYHPSGPTAAETAAGYTGSDFEFLELLNVSNETLDLTGVTFTDGVLFSFTGSSIQTLAPGARVLIVSNPAAFAARYGAGLPVAGAFTGSLSNSGELLRAVDANGATIVQFTYDTRAPWPASPDGNGPALVLVNATANPDPSVAANWRSSASAGGSPGVSDALGYAAWASANSVADATGLSDDDHDGAANLLEYALGTNPRQAAPLPAITVVQTIAVNGVPANYLTITFTHALGRDDAALTVESSSDLTQSWTPAVPLDWPVYNGDGTESVTYRHPIPATVGASQFLRIKAVR